MGERERKRKHVCEREEACVRERVRERKRKHVCVCV